MPGDVVEFYHLFFLPEISSTLTFQPLTTFRRAWSITSFSIVSRKANVVRGEKQTPIPFGNRLQLNPKIYIESPTPKRVGYTLPKIGENGNSINLLTLSLNLLRASSLFIKIPRLKVPQISIDIPLYRKQKDYQWRNLRFIDKLSQMPTMEFQYKESAC